MMFACVLAVTVLACFALRRGIHRYPAVLYLFAVTLDGAYAAAYLFGAPFWLWQPLFLLVQKCYLSLALFAVVMYLGCLPRDSAATTWLRPVRAELSIAACLLAAGHMAAYLGTYVSMTFSGALKGNVALAFVVAMALLILLLVLGITSAQRVKRLMTAERWLAVQRWSYVFFGLVYAHVALMLAPAAFRGGASAQESLAVYTAVFGVYAVARIARALADRREAAGEAGAALAEATDPSSASRVPALGDEWEESPVA